MPSLNSDAWTDQTLVKEHLGITTTTYDNYLINLCNRAKAILENYIGGQVKSKQYTEYYDGDSGNDGMVSGSGKLVLKHKPIISVSAVYVDVLRVFGSDTLMDSGCYYVDTDKGTIEIYQAAGSGPNWFTKGRRNIKVIYTAGFTSIPDDLVQAANEYVAWLFRRAGTEGTVSQSLGGKSETYDDSQIPQYLKLILNQYKDYIGID